MFNISAEIEAHSRHENSTFGFRRHRFELLSVPQNHVILRPPPPDELHVPKEIGHRFDDVVEYNSLSLFSKTLHGSSWSK